jgi:H+-transporting ATPase
MVPNDAPLQAAGSKPGSKPDPNEALKSLSMPDLQAKLGSSQDGLTQAEAQKRLTQYGPNEIEEKKTNEVLKFLSYFWGPIPPGNGRVRSTMAGGRSGTGWIRFSNRIL